MRVVLAVCSGRPAFFDALIPDRGIAAMSAELRRLGVDHRVFDLNHPRTSPGRFVQEVRRYRPDLVGLKFFDTGYLEVESLCETLRTEIPSVRIVAAGPHPTLFREAILDSSDCFDLVVAGEGEPVLPALLEWVARGGAPEAVPSAIFRRPDGSIQENARRLVDDLDALAFPAWDVFPLEDYLPVAMLSTYRGCPYTCAFCAHNHAWGYDPRDRGYRPILRKRSIASVRQEVDEAMSTHGLRLFGFCDSIPNRELTLGFARHLEGLPAPRLWTSFGYVGQFASEELGILARSGCVALWYGIESGCPELRARIGKRFSNDDVLSEFAAARSHGILPIPGFVVGFPGETTETLQRTHDLVAALASPVTVISPYILDPGTPVSLDPRRFGVEMTPDWKRRIVKRAHINEWDIHHYTVDGVSNVDHWARFASSSGYPGYDRDRNVAESEYAYLVARAIDDDPTELVRRLDRALKTNDIGLLRGELKRIWSRLAGART